MADSNGYSPDPLMRLMVRRPYAFDFFRAVRLLECRREDLPRVGFSLFPSEDPVRFWQKPSLRFPPSALDSIRASFRVELERGIDEFFKNGKPPADSHLPLRIILNPQTLERLQAEDK